MSTPYQSLEKLLTELLPPMKPATLPIDVIQAVVRYTEENDRKVIAAWLHTTQDLNAVDKDGRSLLHHAAKAGAFNMVRYLVKCGLDIHLEDHKGYTPMLLAAAHRNENAPSRRLKVLDIIRHLIEHGATFTSPHSLTLPQSAINIAASLGDFEVFKLLVDNHCPYNQDTVGTPLWWAERVKQTQGTKAIARWLRAHGAQAKMTTSKA